MRSAGQTLLSRDGARASTDHLLDTDCELRQTSVALGRRTGVSEQFRTLLIDGPEGETISRNQDGSLNVTSRTPEGGHVTTTLRNSGQGVDVNVQSANFLRGGELVDHNEDPPWAHPNPTQLPPLYPF